jgi:hypothetical protein
MDAALAGLPSDFPHAGQVYKVMPRTLGAELLFQTWLEDLAYLVLVKHRARLGEAEFARLSGAWARDCAAGVYEWGGEAAWRKMLTDAGQEKLLWLKIAEGAAGHKGPPLTEEEVHLLHTRHPEDWARLLALMQRQDFPEAAQGEGEGADPNAPAPEGAPPAGNALAGG